MDVCVCVCVYVYAWISASTRSILTGQVSFFLFFLCDGGSKIRFLIGPIRFCFISNFRFSQNCFLLFFNERIEIFKSDWYHRKEHRKTYNLKKKNFSSYHGSLVIDKNVFFFKKLITPKLNGQFF